MTDFGRYYNRSDVEPEQQSDAASNPRTGVSSDTNSSNRIAQPSSAPISDVATSLRERLQSGSTLGHVGRIVKAVGTSLRVSGLPVHIGQRCEIYDKHSGHVLRADVVGLEQGDAILVPLGGLHGLALDSEVRVVAEQVSISVSDALLGRVVDGFGQPLDDSGDISKHSAALLTESSNSTEQRMPLRSTSPNPLRRKRVEHSLETGIKAIDAVIPLGVGQRVGIFAPAGAGKSTLLGMLAGNIDCDVIVIGLIGERGREVREFLEDTLSAEARARSVVVVATSDSAAMERVSAAETATAIAEGFRAQGKHVVLLMDSVTRFARALRELGLAIGEPPVRQGYTPSVFAELPRLFERSGNNEAGCISAFYTVLTDDDTGSDPIAEETRSILDGHIVLSRSLSEKGHFPAIDVLASQSRLFATLASEEHQQAALTCRSLLAKYREIEFLIQVGEYQQGSDALADAAIASRAACESLLQQASDKRVSLQQTLESLKSILAAQRFSHATETNRTSRNDVHLSQP